LHLRVATLTLLLPFTKIVLHWACFERYGGSPAAPDASLPRPGGERLQHRADPRADRRARAAGAPPPDPGLPRRRADRGRGPRLRAGRGARLGGRGAGLPQPLDGATERGVHLEDPTGPTRATALEEIAT